MAILAYGKILRNYRCLVIVFNCQLSEGAKVSKGSKTRVVSVRGDEVSWFVGAGNLRSRQQRRSR